MTYSPTGIFDRNTLRRPPGGGRSSIVTFIARRPLRRAALVLTLLLAPLALLPAAIAQPPQPAAAGVAASVNVNRADAETLAAALNGVGLARAREIVRYRETFGPFTSVEELAEVKGIGPATIDRNRAVITLD